MVSKKLLNRLKNAHDITVLTGPDIAGESGVQYDKDWQGHAIEKLLSADSLKNEPGLFWQYINRKRREIAQAKPNLGHYALVDFEKYFGQFNLLTLNYDGLQTKAGSKKVLELSGNIMRTKCTKCSYTHMQQDTIEDTPVACPECQSLLRPDIVLNGEEINAQTFANAQEASATCEVFFSIGAPYLSDKVSSIPFIAKGNGSYLVQISTGETTLSAHADETIPAKAGKILPLMVIVLEKIK